MASPVTLIESKCPFEVIESITNAQRLVALSVSGSSPLDSPEKRGVSASVGEPVLSENRIVLWPELGEWVTCG